ncbi:MAG: VWA domain-containing protein, partial [Nitrospinota bacterium]
LRAHFILDASGSMDYGQGPLTKWGYAATLTASMAHLLLRQSDAVGLMLSRGQDEKMIPAKAVRGHLTGLLAALDAERPAGGTGIARSLERMAEGLRRRGMVVVVSDLLDDPAAVTRGLSLLRLKGNDVIVFHVLDFAELDFPFDGLARMEDVETDRNVTVECEVVKDPYLALLKEFLDTTRERCRSQGIDYVLLSTAEPLDRGLVRFLAWRAKAK